MAIKIRSTTFGGNAKLADGTLAMAVRALAIDHALIKINAMTLADIKFTDETTGVVGATIGDILIPLNPITAATGNAGVQRTALVTPFGRIDNVVAVLMERINTVRAPLGLNLPGTGEGNIDVPGTIPLIQKTITGANTTNAAEFTTTRAALLTMKSNVRKVVEAASETLIALGMPPLDSELTGTYVTGGLETSEVEIVSANAGGTDAIARSAVDAAMSAIADAVATVAWTWNAAMDNLTDRPLGVVADK